MANFDLEGFGGALGLKPKGQSTNVVAPNDQRNRDDNALLVLQSELSKAQQGFASAKTPEEKTRYGGDVAGLLREIKLKGGQVQTQAPQEVSPQSQNAFDLEGFGKALSGKATSEQMQSQFNQKVEQEAAPKLRLEEQLGQTLLGQKGYEGLQGFAMGAGKNISQGIAGLQQLAGKGIGMIAPETGAAIAENAAKNARSVGEKVAPYEQRNPVASTVGEVAGAIASPANKLIPMGNATGIMGLAQGAGQGALSSILTTPVTDENKAFLTEKLKQGLAGGLGGAAGTAIARAPGAIAEPFKKSLGDIGEKAVKTLRDAGVPLDIAQATGSSFLQRSKAMLNDNPFTAGKEAAFAAAQKSAYNNAIAKTMGEDVTAITPDVIQAAKTRLGQNYDDLASRNQIHFDHDLKKSLEEINDRASNALADTQHAVIQKAIKSIESKAESTGGVINGEQYKNIKRLLNDIEKQNVPGSHYAGEMKELLLESLSRSAEKTGNKADVALLKETNRQYGNMKKIEDIVSKDVEGNVSPSLLSNSLATKSKRNALYQDDPQLANLARAGKLILENKTPNSGTVSRLAAQAAPAAIAGGLYGLYEGDLAGAAKGAAVGFAIPKAMQAAANNPALARYFEQGMAKGPVRSALQAPQNLGGMLPQYMQKPGVAGNTALRELINQRNLEAQ